MGLSGPGLKMVPVGSIVALKRVISHDDRLMGEIELGDALSVPAAS